jgi:hypothetical protein
VNLRPFSRPRRRIKELLKVYVDIPVPQRSEALRMLTAVDKIIAEKKID